MWIRVRSLWPACPYLAKCWRATLFRDRKIWRHSGQAVAGLILGQTEIPVDLVSGLPLIEIHVQYNGALRGLPRSLGRGRLNEAIWCISLILNPCQPRFPGFLLGGSFPIPIAFLHDCPPRSGDFLAS
jgi:hypothetical protein